jgi:hypothetical protein
MRQGSCANVLLHLWCMRAAAPKPEAPHAQAWLWCKRCRASPLHPLARHGAHTASHHLAPHAGTAVETITDHVLTKGEVLARGHMHACVLHRSKLCVLQRPHIQGFFS